MYHLHLTRNLRSLAFLLLTTVIVAAGTLLWWANRTGLPDSWRAWIEREIAREGLHMEIGALSYLPLRGVVASEVKVFSDATGRNQVSHLERVLLDIDKTKLARGELRLNKIELRNASLSLPIDEEHPQAGALQVENASGTLLMPGGNRFEIRDARGRVSGIDVSMNARLTGRQASGKTGESAQDRSKRRELLARIFEELARWDFDPAKPPRLRVFLVADVNRRDSIEARITLEAEEIAKRGHRLEKLSADAQILGELLTVTRIEAADFRGRLDGRLDYDIAAREGRFDIATSLAIEPLLSAWFKLPPLPGQIVIGGSQSLDAQGGFRLDDQHIPELQMTGRLHAESVMLRGVLFDHVESAFAWRDSGVFLRDLRLTRPDGQASGKALIQWPLVRMALHSTLPSGVYQPLFAGQPLEQVLQDFVPRDGASFDVRLEGGFDATAPHSWAYVGGGTAANFSFRGVPLASAECRFSLNHEELDFHSGTVVFDHHDYALRRDFGGPERTTARVGRIRYVASDKLVHVENVSGNIWAAPLVRLFASKLADHLESYRFHMPPKLAGSGVVDVTPGGRTRLNVSFQSAADVNYRFLGEDIRLSQPGGEVRVNGSKVHVNDLRLSAFNGPLTASFIQNDNGRIEGEIAWTRLDLSALTTTYGHELKSGGLFTGRIEFDLTGGRVETMNGDGLFALEKTELFSVPVFGPLSPLISGVLQDRRAGFERAKSAFCTFRIREGILRSNDFQTSTTSLNFAGEGEVDLARRTFDMTMRMNARGLLGLITLPLRPFYGMFQFRGNGPLDHPVWENVIFSTPSPAQAELLRQPPKAKVVAAPQ